MLFTRCARQAKLISDGMSDERTLEIQRAALELQQFEGYVRSGQPLLTQLSLPSTGPPSSTAGDGHHGHREARGRGSEHRASVQAAESLRKGGQQPRRPGRAGPALPEKELTKLVLRQADTLSLPAAGPGLHGVSQDLHEAWAIVTDLEVGGSNQPRATEQLGLVEDGKFLYLKWNPNTRSHEKTDRDQHCPGEGIPRPDQAEPPLPEGHPAVPCATPADRNHDGGHRSVHPRDPQALPRSPPDLHCDGEAQLQCGVAPGRGHRMPEQVGHRATGAKLPRRSEQPH